MYSDNLREDTISITRIHLDPNNPRFWSEKTVRETPEKRISEPQIQQNTFAQIRGHGIQELRDSILRNGFLPLDRIVVRPISGDASNYVVVEGNRRLAALRQLRQEISDGIVAEQELDEEYLQRLLSSTDCLNVLIYEGTNTRDISWVFQGIRHISGIRPWEPAQRARLVAEKIDGDGLGFRETGQMFGLSARAVGRFYRSFKALEAMRQDPEFGSKAQNDYFSLFDEAYQIAAVRGWLGWDDGLKQFTNSNNLQQFYAWITPEEENEGKRRLHDPKHIKKLGDLLAGGHQTLISQIDSFEIGIEEAWLRAVGLEDSPDWRARLEQASRLIADLPQRAISEDPEVFLSELGALEAAVASVKAMATALVEQLVWLWADSRVLI